MCGITGAVRRGGLLTTRDQIAGMNQTLACRGPDAAGLWSSDEAALAHRRLAVIDIAGGAQPMSYGPDAAITTFCGEIYNYRELRTQLAGRGYHFDSHSDTEVLLAAYLEWGEDCWARLEGMFAVAIWIPARRELVLARDPLGIKPLYYSRTDAGTIVFGSEIKAVLAHPEVRPTVTAAGLYEFLDMSRTPGASVYQGILEVRPGSTLSFRDDTVREEVYWRLEARPHEDDLPTTTRRTRELLTRAVQLQSHADVPLGCLLSGGIDSSAVAALLAGSGGDGPLDVFSIDFTADRENFVPDAVRREADMPFARMMAELLHARHHEVGLSADQLADPRSRQAILRAVDYPPAYWGDMWSSLYHLFRAVGAECKVALSGEGADELFGGYIWFHNPAAVDAPTFPWLTPGSARYFGGIGLLNQELLAAVDIETRRADAYADAINQVPRLPGEDAADRRAREISYLALTRFLPTLLDRKDRMSMAVGVEGRVPFCDRTLVDYVFNVPWAMKSAGNQQKALLRESLRGILPDAIIDRRKTPYPATQDLAYHKLLQLELGEVLADPGSPVLPLLDLERARAVADKPTAVSKPYHRGSIEMTLWLNSWLETYQPHLALERT